VLSIRAPFPWCWVTLNLGFFVGPGMADLPTLRLQQLGSRTCLLWEGGPCDLHCNEVCLTWGTKLIEMPFPSSDQRYMQESLSKAKRKHLLLQKGAATDHSLIGRTYWAGSQLSFYLCPSPWWTGLGSQSSQLVT
jgi:hypothetical protein